jgi:hypothetical protein
VVELGFLKGFGVRLGPIARNGDELGIAVLGNFSQPSRKLINRPCRRVFALVGQDENIGAHSQRPVLARFFARSMDAQTFPRNRFLVAKSIT